jgi:hypothetical protein
MFTSYARDKSLIEHKVNITRFLPSQKQMLRLVWDGSLGIVFTFFNLQVSSKRNKDERVLELCG